MVLLVDPSLRTNEDDSSTVALLILIDGQANVSNYDTSEAREPFAVIAEGLPPIPQKMLEKIQRWEFISGVFTMLRFPAEAKHSHGLSPR